MLDSRVRGSAGQITILKDAVGAKGSPAGQTSVLRLFTVVKDTVLRGLLVILMCSVPYRC